MRTERLLPAFPCPTNITSIIVIVIIIATQITYAAFIPHWPHWPHNRQRNSNNHDTNKLYSSLYDKSVVSDIPFNAKNSTRQIRSLILFDQERNHQRTIPSSSSCQAGKKPAVFGLRCDNGEMVDGELLIKANEAAQIILIGQNLELNFSLALTPTLGQPGEDCTHMDRVKSIPVLTYLTTTSAQVEFNLPWPGSKMPYYMCIRELKDIENNTLNINEPWYHQGSHNLVRLYVHQEWLPLYMKIINIIMLLMLSGLFSGLNLGLMALDKNELAVIISCGSETEKRYARAIEPVRRRGNYLLCSILFSNVLVNSTIAVLLEDFTSGSVAVMTSTIFIVMFGEILPQAFCSRHGLAVGAKTVAITYLCMILTCPLSYPVSACLDWALGEEINHAYDRERLMEFIKITSDYNNLETEEVNIISGALKLKRVHISEVMTRIEDAFMLDVTASLDFETIKSIIENGYSRVPVHEPNNKRHIIAILLTKDLAFIDPDDKTPIQTLISFYNHPVMFMFEDTTLHSALNEFKTGKSHMAFVRRVIDDGDRDPIYEVTGIVTFEDVIEEILQMEINDETDTITDNRRKRRRKEAQVRSDFLQFTSRQSTSGDKSHDICVTPQLCLAAYQFLSTNVEPFTRKFLTDSILKKLLAQKIYYKLRVDSSNTGNNDNLLSSLGSSNNAERILYRAGQPADYFIMILEGRVSVICGLEQLSYEGGPFSYYGKRALLSDKMIVELQPIQQQTQRSSITSSKQKSSIPNFRKLSPTNTNFQQQYQFAIPLKKLDSSANTSQEQSYSVDDDDNQGEKSNLLMTSMSSDQIVANQTNALANQQQHNGSSQSIISMGAMRQQQQEQQLLSQQLVGTELSSPKFGGKKHSVANLFTRNTNLSSTFIPDYTVQVITNASYLKITRDQYLTALKACLLDSRSLSIEQELNIEQTAIEPDIAIDTDKKNPPDNL